MTAPEHAEKTSASPPSVSTAADAEQKIIASSSPPAQGSPVRGALSAELPEGWFYKESIELLHPDGRANVIVSTEPVADHIDTKQYAEIQGDLLKGEFPGYREMAFEPMDVFGGFDGYLRSFEWHPPNGVPVTQLQVYCVVANRGLTATATSPSSDFPEFELQLIAVLESLAAEMPVLAAAELAQAATALDPQ